ncbi:MAG TPA: hypothetical protein VFC07_14165, partial [Verrucomicrobiae bacterium]|nr:hypothetical protein [Verrucomicrobiae bacterium]
MALAAFFFVMGGFMLCYCPGEFVTAAVLAGVAAWCGTRRVRALSVLLLAVSVVVGGIQARKEAKFKARMAKVRQQIR